MQPCFLVKKNHGLTWSTMVCGQNKPIWNNMVNHVFGLNKPWTMATMVWGHKQAME